MPWSVEKRGDNYCVVKKGNTDPVPGGCHAARTDAVKHLRALYANVPEAMSAAAVAPVAPPLDWFDAEEPDGPEPLTIEKDGRVHGHLALWDACHTGFMNGPLAKCVMAPRSMTSYAGFHLGQLETAEGEMIPVGKIVYGGPHASLTAGLEAAREHYDRTSSVGAFVRAKDGRFGPYLTGAAKSDLSPEGLRDIRANPPSGDWRGMRGSLELIGILAVGVPGFQTPVLTADANGNVDALILPGYCDCIEEAPMERDRSYIRRKRVISTALTAAALTTKRRNDLPAKSFALPGERRYPIHDLAHARNALARSSGKPEEAQVRRAVCRRYPDLCASK